MRLIDADALNGYKFGLISPYAQNLFHKTINEAPTIDYKRLLEQEPCTDAISMDKTIVQLSHLLSDWDDDWNVAIRKCIETVKTVPLVTPAEKVGQWIDIQYFKVDDTYYRPKCPFCSIEPREYSNYCPNCGANMASPTGAERSDKE